MQGGSTGIVYGGLKYQARCIADVTADTEHTSFLAGTLSLKDENEVHLIRLLPSEMELVCEGLFYHSNEIWDLKSCPFDQRIFSTVYTNGETHGAAIWGISELHGQTNALEQLLVLKEHTYKIKCILWWPLGKYDKIISIDEGNLFLWNIDSSTKAAKVISQESVGMLHNLSGGAWDPHDQNTVAVILDSSLQCWDLRSMNIPSLSTQIKQLPSEGSLKILRKSNSIEHALVRDLDYNPKKQHILVTAEDESGLRLWDLRMPKSPVNEFPGHAHWTWAVRHNPEHDQLILSAGTDSTVNLWLNNDSTHESMHDSPTRFVDPLLSSYDDYEDSVYAIAWSSRDPTLFASLSYDGRVVVESIKHRLHKR